MGGICWKDDDIDCEVEVVKIQSRTNACIRQANITAYGHRNDNADHTIRLKNNQRRILNIKRAVVKK